MNDTSRFEQDSDASRLKAMGDKCRDSRDVAGAMRYYNQALSIDPDFFQVHANLANMLADEARFEEAVEHNLQAIALCPDMAELFDNLGDIYQRSGQPGKAVENHLSALNINPDLLSAHYNLGTAYAFLGRWEEALAACDRVVNAAPDFAPAQNNRGNVLKELGRYEDAVHAYERAVSLQPQYAEAWHNLGGAFRVMGRREAAIEAYRKALQINPDFVEAHLNLAITRRHETHDDEVQAMENLFNKDGMDVESRSRLGFALGKAYEDLADDQKAFSFITEANRFKRSTYTYSTSDDAAFFSSIAASFDASLFAGLAHAGCADVRPVFIVGMPRSGTSLVEQILSSHPQVFGAGELTDLGRVIETLCQDRGGYPAAVSLLQPGDLAVCGQAYVDRVRERAPDAQRIIDKMPQNFLYVGMIRLLLPDARIIHCRREPMDTCFSIFKHGFLNLHRYAYDQQELGSYYRLYQQLMAHWRDVLPGFMYELNYETLVANHERETHRLLEYCGLPWDDACLSFHKTERVVRTASTTQVRRPIYTDSVKRWKRFEAGLAPLREALGSNPD